LRLSSMMAWAAIGMALGAFTGCTDNSSNMNQLNQNEFALRGMIASDRQQIDALQAQLRRTQDEVEELKHSGVSASGASASADVNDRLAKLESEMNAMQAAMPMPPPSGAVPGGVTPPPAAAGLAPGAAPASPPPSVASAPPAPSAVAPGAASAGAEPAPTWPQDVDTEIAAAQSSKDPGAKIYRKGLDAMKTGNYPSAIVQFAKIQHSYPKSPLSEPSQYFIANAFYENGKYEQAVLQFNDLTMRFPSSRFLCESLLREGQSFMRLNDRIDARLTLQKLSSNSNCSNESVAANNMLKNLGSD